MAPALRFGVDFTSAPSSRKAIRVARANLRGHTLHVDAIEALTSFAQFEQFLATPGPWLAGFDLPFGLPRELVAQLGWPLDWPQLMQFLAAMPRADFADALNQVRQSRPAGSRYIARRGDAAAGSSSPMKLVNPPVGLMLFEGAPRLHRARLCVVPCAMNDDARIAVEAYPGFLARQLTRASYKKDGREGMLPARRSARELIVEALERPSPLSAGIAVRWPAALRKLCLDDGSGDSLDAVICALQAAIAGLRHAGGDPRFGIPADADPLEGWIATVGAP